jgi:ComF family protein
MPMPELGRVLTALLAPPLCGTCGSPCAATKPICSTCSRALAAARGGTAELAGVGPVSWASEYRGVARDLITALKFGQRLPLAAVAAEAIAATVDPAPLTAVVPVPAAPARRRHRGFDPAEQITTKLADQLGLPRASPLRRVDGPRQVGRRRSERLAAPPRVRAVGAMPERVLLIDDVLTTGATLTACAATLRDAGAIEIQAAVFARAFGRGRIDP